nr:MAG TPA: hypothetical protein [Caudoviricetes sp.]
MSRWLIVQLSANLVQNKFETRASIGNRRSDGGVVISHIRRRKTSKVDKTAFGVFASFENLKSSRGVVYNKI